MTVAGGTAACVRLPAWTQRTAWSSDSAPYALGFDYDVTSRRTMLSIAASRDDSRCGYGVNSIGQVFGTHDGGETWQEFPLPVWFRKVHTIACA